MMSRHENKPRILVVLGPTASGKSALAVELGRRFNGEVVSADSRQVYRGLDIGSGKIMKREMRGIPHHLLDVASPKRTFTVAQYQKLGRKAIRDILRRGKLPIICGGTGFYIDALLYDYEFPKVKPNPKLRHILERKTTNELLTILRKLDPGRAATIDPDNKRRLVRAVEIVVETEVSIRPLPAKKSYSNVLKNIRIDDDCILKIGIALPTETLKGRIEKRLLKRLRQGMIREVKKLHKSGVGWKRLDSFGLEYRWVSRYVRRLNHPSTEARGHKHRQLAKDEVIMKLKTETWHYTKRQMTWWKRDKKIQWLDSRKRIAQTVAEFLKK